MRRGVANSSFHLLEVDQMKVLLSAIACNPKEGSEGGVGWKAAMALAEEHEVHVLTSAANRKDIEYVLSANCSPNLSFSFFGLDAPYHENRLFARGQSWLRYMNWMRQVLPEAQMLLAARSFDLVHHVTFSTCRVASPLWKLGMPFVFGPSGGGEITPPVTMGSMSRGQRVYEMLRKASNTLLLLNRRVRDTVTHAAVLLASNRATATLFEKLGAQSSSIVHLPVVFFTDEQLREFSIRPKTWGKQHEPLRLFSSGMLEGRKGISIALHAMAIARRQGVSLEFVIPSRGPEFAHLKRLASSLSLSDVVHFPDSLPRGEFWKMLMSSDIYIGPSLRDNCPATLLEAMLCRCVPFVVDCNGPGEMVPESTGIKIKPSDPEEMAAKFAEALVELSKSRDKLRDLGNAAAEHVMINYTQQHYLATVNRAYAQATNKL